jgi:hypothetical protein
MQYLCRARQHALTRVEPGAAGILDLLYLGALLAYHGPHARVGDHEFNGYGATARHRGHVERFVVYASHYEPERL